MTLPFDLSSLRTAVVTIDMHRGHLDPAVATMPVEPAVGEQLVAHNIALLDRMRAAGVPVVHVITSYRNKAEIRGNRWWATVAGTDASRSRVLEHQLEGGPGIALAPGMLQDGDFIVDTKKRYDCFIATDLDHLLRSLGVEALLLTGINTSSCVLATAIAANVRDYAVVVVSDCVATMDSRLHEPALSLIEGAFGWVLDSDEVTAALGA